MSAHEGWTKRRQNQHFPCLSPKIVLNPPVSQTYSIAPSSFMTTHSNGTTHPLSQTRSFLHPKKNRGPLPMHRVTTGLRVAMLSHRAGGHLELHGLAFLQLFLHLRRQWHLLGPEIPGVGSEMWWLGWGRGCWRLVVVFLDFQMDVYTDANDDGNLTC